MHRGIYNDQHKILFLNAETATHLVDYVIPRVPVRQWVLSFPIPLRTLFAADAQLLSPVLRVIHRVIATFLIKQAGLKRSEADTGAITLIQRFGSAANLNIHLLSARWGLSDQRGRAVFHECLTQVSSSCKPYSLRSSRARLLTRQGALIEEQGMTYLA